MHTIGLQQLGEDLPHETVADHQRLLIRAQLEQVETMHCARHRFDGRSIA